MSQDDAAADRDPSDRTKLVAHYIIARSVPERLGFTKLNKVMFFADVVAYRHTGKTITGQASYQKQQYGPVPNGIVKTVKSLIAEGKIQERRVTAGKGQRREFVWLKEPDVSAKGREERRLESP